MRTRSSEFQRQAATLCRLLAGHAKLPLRTFLHRVHESLPRVYAAALALPDVSPVRDASYRSVTPEAWRRLYRSIEARLGGRTYYSEVFDAYGRKNGKALIGNLADDLAEVHADLANGLRCWRTGDRENAVWYWRFMREAHWGEHATSAIRALYWLHRNAAYGPVSAMPNYGVQRTAGRRVRGRSGKSANARRT
jgi:hypothetical protein